MSRDPPDHVSADSAPLRRPRRIWDENRQVWIEAHVLCRRGNGRWDRKNGREPIAQLLLFSVSTN